MSHATLVDEIEHLGNRGHLYTMTDDTGQKIKVCNVYAPNGFDEGKVAFYHEVFNLVGQWDGDLILGGGILTLL